MAAFEVPGLGDLVYELESQARDARGAGRFAAAETLLIDAARLADAQGDLAARIRIRYWLANDRRMQARHMEALATYAWLIRLAYDPRAAAELQGDDEAIRCLASAFMDFVAVGRLLPGMLTARLHQVIDLGMAFLSDAGRGHWACGLRFQRGMLLRAEGRLAEARQELLIAQALRRRHFYSPGYTIGTHLCGLGDVERELAHYAAAERAYREAWESSGQAVDRRWAAEGLAWLELERKNPTGAEGILIE